MTETRSEYEKEYERHVAAQDRFEYFVLAATLTLLGFGIERFNPEADERYLILLFTSWVFLLVSFLAGLHRREAVVIMSRISAQRFENQELLGPLRGAVLGGESVVTPQGVPWGQSEIRTKLSIAEEVEAKAKCLLDEESVKAKRSYRVARISLLIGILMYAGFKILNAFVAKASCLLF